MPTPRQPTAPAVSQPRRACRPPSAGAADAGPAAAPSLAHRRPAAPAHREGDRRTTRDPHPHSCSTWNPGRRSPGNPEHASAQLPVPGATARENVQAAGNVNEGSASLRRSSASVGPTSDSVCHSLQGVGRPRRSAAGGSGPCVRVVRPSLQLRAGAEPLGGCRCRVPGGVVRPWRCLLLNVPC